MKNSFGVYELTVNTDHDSKYYIGSTTVTFYRRYQQHLYNLKSGTHHNHYLQNLWNKYQNIYFKVLEVCLDKNVVAQREQFWIETKDPETLINHGPALPNPCLGTHHSEETRKKLSISHTNPSAEIRKHYSESHIGEKHTPEQIEKIRAANTGRKHSKEFCERLSEIKKNQSKETLKKIALANTGKVRTAEQRQKMADAQKQRFANPEEVNKTRHGTIDYFAQHREMKTHTRLPGDIWAKDLIGPDKMGYREAYEYLNAKKASGELISIWVFDQGIRKRVFRKASL